MKRFSTLLLSVTSALFCAFWPANSLAGTVSWQFTGKMNDARALHTATLLSDGRVLVAGGVGRGDSPESAEFYDPATAQWVKTQPLGYPVVGHSATRLQDGTVLVAGGFDYGHVIPMYVKATLWNPVTGTWTQTGDMNRGRASHSATLLADGEVLVAGGSDDNGLTATAEIYNPATGQWRLTGRLNQGRLRHNAVLLKDGKVLVTGGEDNDSTVLSSAELYDPETESWSTTGSMSTARVYFTLSLLRDGMALAVGGFLACPVCSSLKSTELYDPTTGLWTPSGDLSVGRSRHAVAQLSKGKVAVIGGWDENLDSTTSVEVYNPTQHSWATVGSLCGARIEHTATRLLDSRILVTGGESVGDADELKTAELGTNAR